MRIKLMLLSLLLVSCSSGKPKISVTERFSNEMIDSQKIGGLVQLTEDGRNVFPIFAPGDSMVFYKRLLITDAADTFLYNLDEMIRPYGMGITNRELYTLSNAYDYPPAVSLKPVEFPKRYSEKVVWALRSPVDTSVIAFETASSPDNDAVHSIYLATGDSIVQLTYGETSCYLDRFSNTGRYISAIYDQGPTWLIIYDTTKRQWFRINHEGNYIDYLTYFSPNDSMMLFVRSDKKYRVGRDYFGDIWLLKFNK